MTNLNRMFETARFLPESASSFAKADDQLMIYMLLVSGVFTLGIFATLAFFIIKYRQREGNLVAHKTETNMLLEFSWAAIPFAIFLAAFVWGALHFLEIVTPPDRAEEVLVIGKQWMWKTEHRDGISEINKLHVPVGHDIKLIMISEDVIHSFSVPDFRLKYDVLPGRYTQAWFRAEKAGTYPLVCTQYCGSNHPEMIGEVIAMEFKDFESWKKTETIPNTTEERGRKLFSSAGCTSCHSPPPAGLGSGPVLQGRFTVNDRDRVREDILRPSVRIADGYTDVMPPFAGVLKEADVFALVSYLTQTQTQPQNDAKEPLRD